MNQKHQVSGRSKDGFKIKPDQKDYKSYGLLSFLDYSTEPLDKAPKVLAGDCSGEYRR